MVERDSTVPSEFGEDAQPSTDVGALNGLRYSFLTAVG
jgi:hypothetical protein